MRGNKCQQCGGVDDNKYTDGKSYAKGKLQVKIFQYGIADPAEDQANSWLAENNVGLHHTETMVDPDGKTRIAIWFIASVVAVLFVIGVAVLT